MNLIYGYSKDDSGNSNGDNGSLKSLVGSKTDSAANNTAFGRIQKNEEDIVSSTASVVASTSKVIASVVSTVGQKKDNKTVDSAFGRIRKNKEDISIINSFVGSTSSFEGESNLKGTQLSHASAITAHSNNLLELEDIVGYKDSSVGKLVPAVKLASGLLGTKTDNKTVDTAFGRIEKNKSDVEKLKVVEFKETSGSFVAPTNDGKVEITGWSMPENNTVIAVTLKAKVGLTGVIKATIYSGDSLANSNHLMASPMQLSDMKLGRAAILFTGRNPRHTKIFANTRGNAVGTVAERTVNVKFVYIDHTDKT